MSDQFRLLAFMPEDLNVALVRDARGQTHLLHANGTMTPHSPDNSHWQMSPAMPLITPQTMARVLKAQPGFEVDWDQHIADLRRD